MLKTPLQRSSLLAILGLAIAALPSLSYADHSWGGYHWARTTDTFTLKLGDNLNNSDWKTMLAQASQNWNSPVTFSTTSPLLTSVVAGQAGSRCSMVTGTVQVCNAKYGNNGWLGIATINITGNVHITRGSVKMNDTYFSNLRYNYPNEKLHVMCQEIGHTFGLDHQSTDGNSLNTCMDYFANIGVNSSSILSTTPNFHDFEELGIIYSHLDSTNTIAAITAALAASSSDVSDATDDPKNWGQLKKQSKTGLSSTYEKYNRDGSLNLTHVYWTDEAAAACPSCDHRYDRSLLKR